MIFRLLLLLVFIHCALGFGFERRDGKLLAAVPLTGNIFCTATAPIVINNQTYAMGLDTGSSDFVVATTECSVCGVSPAYSGSLSTTEASTSFGSSDNPQSVSGYLINNLDFSIGGLSAQMVALGVTSQYQFFESNCISSGQVGLAYSSIAQYENPTFMDALAASGVPNGFALQFCNQSSFTSKVGNFWIGGYDSSFTTSQMQFIAITQQSYYNVEIIQITVAGKVVSLPSNINSPTPVIDSGTDIIIINTEDNFNAVINALTASNIIFWSTEVPETNITSFWQKAIAISTKLCAINKNFQMTINFLGAEGEPVSLPISPFNLFTTEYLPSGASRLLFTGIGYSEVGTIMGMPFFINNVLFFDRVASRIGFAPGTNCFSAISTQGIDNFPNSTSHFVPPTGGPGSSPTSSPTSGPGSSPSSGNSFLPSPLLLLFALFVASLKFA